MYVCRACARRLPRPPSVLFSRGRQIPISASTSISTSTSTSTSTRPTAPTWGIATETSRGPQLVLRRGFASAAAASARRHAAPPPEGSQLQLAKDADEPDEAATAAAAAAATKARLDKLSKRRLQFLKDPYTIGKHVEEALVKDNYEEALHLTRMASKDHQVTVSWNHLIGYLMRKEKLTAAIKLYNEMKKRAQLPNAQTYTIIFRGCAQSPHAGLAVGQATRLYYAMLHNERIAPNTIHMNAVLQVCARARDLDSLFSVVKTADGRLRTPNNLTYTTVLNGLRHATARPHHRGVRVGADEVHVNKEQVAVSIARARAVWEEVVANWRQGRLFVDEELVCAMGRLLLLGGHHDNDDILSLVEQTIGVPRLDRDWVQKTLPPSASASAVPATEEAAAAATADGASDDEPPLSPPHTRPTQFVPLPPGIISSEHSSHGGGGGRRGRVAYAQPGRNVLSMVLTSLGKTRKTSLAARYWGVLTSPPYSVVPDSEDWFRLLVALRRGHASTKTAELLQTMPPALMNERTFRLAMATCAADNLNDHVFASAGKILDLMSQTLRAPDPHTLRLYLQTAVTNSRRFRVQGSSSSSSSSSNDGAAAREAAKFAFGRQIVRALSRLWDPLRLASNALALRGPMGPAASMSTPASSSSLSSSSSSSSSSDDDEGRGQKYNAQREVIALARQMVSAADMVISEGMADEATIKDLRTSRNLLNRQITRFYRNREEIEPNLKRKKAKGGAKAKEEESEWMGETGETGKTGKTDDYTRRRQPSREDGRDKERRSQWQGP